MKNFPKTYENVFSEDRSTITFPLKIDKLSADGMTINEYTIFFHEFLKDFYCDLFLNCVKLAWLRRKFVFYGEKMNFPIYKNSHGVQVDFQRLMTRVIGNSIHIITMGPFYSKLETHYFNQLFPDFDEGNPFENPDYYKFPFKNISLEFLMVVYQMKDRMELLKYADDNKMSYAIFSDYIINHIMSENEKLGKERYQVFKNASFFTRLPFFIKDTENIKRIKKGSKRI